MAVAMKICIPLLPFRLPRAFRARFPRRYARYRRVFTDRHDQYDRAPLSPPPQPRRKPIFPLRLLMKRTGRAPAGRAGGDQHGQSLQIMGCEWRVAGFARGPGVISAVPSWVPEQLTTWPHIPPAPSARRRFHRKPVRRPWSPEMYAALRQQPAVVPWSDVLRHISRSIAGATAIGWSVARHNVLSKSLPCRGPGRQ